MKNSCIVIEGPDGSGKSTLARKLQKMGYEYKHFGPVEDPYKSYSEAIDEELEKAKNEYRTGIVFDRIWPSEDVYGSVLREGSRLTDSHIEDLEKKAMRLEAEIILCLPPLSTVQSNVLSRKETDDIEGVRENVKDLWWAYRNYESNLPIHRYDYTSDEFKVRKIMSGGDLHLLKEDLYIVSHGGVVFGWKTKSEVEEIFKQVIK